MKVLGAQKMDFPSKSLKLQMGMAGPIIELITPSKLGEFYTSINCKDAICYNIFNGLGFSEISVECLVHILRRPWITTQYNSQEKKI